MVTLCHVCRAQKAACTLRLFPSRVESAQGGLVLSNISTPASRLQTVSLAVYRPFRFNGSGKDPKSSKYFHSDNISDTHTAFYSRESRHKAPVLTLTVAS